MKVLLDPSFLASLVALLQRREGVLFPLADIGPPENNKGRVIPPPLFTEEKTMKRIALALLLLAALASGCQSKTGPLPPIEIYFSPKGGAADAVVRALDGAKETVFVQAYSFTNKAIAEALIHAHQRGVVIHAILDKSVVKDRYSEADFVANSGIPVLIDSQHPIAHNKIMIIDGETVITGSFNFTNQAEDTTPRTCW